MFEDEKKCYELHCADWLKYAEGKYILIKGNQEYGFFDTDQSAYEAGAQLFGLDSFFIKRILPKDPIVDILALYLGLIRVTI